MLFNVLQAVFRAQTLKNITRVELGGPVGGVRERIFITSGSEIKGFTKKGKNFLQFDTNLSEPVQSMWVNYQKPYGLVNIPEFILKFYVFIAFLIRVISHTNGNFAHSWFDSKILLFYVFFIRIISIITVKAIPGLSRTMERTTNLCIICRYLNLVKKLENNSIAKKLIPHWNFMGKNICYFHWALFERGPFFLH